MPGCLQPASGRKEFDHLARSEVTAITEWELPSPGRYANAIAVAPDGSVWFGEQSLPGVAHFFPNNGTLVEYAWPTWPGEPTGCAPKTSIWGIALWDGMVWASNYNEGSIVGLNPANDTFEVLKLPEANSAPETLTVGPDGALWFTAITSSAVVGRISPSLSVSMYPVLDWTDQLPSQISFVNSTFAYYTALDPLAPSSSGLYSFDPQNVSEGITPSRVGGNTSLSALTGLALSDGEIWVDQHITSNVWGYNTTSGEWTIYPTSTENYTATTLPYFVETSGGTVWLNEHYANEIAELEPAAGTLTEYSESDPPASNYSTIQNDLTIATAPGGLWLTSMTGNYIGFLNASYVPSFSVSVEGSNSLTLSNGTAGVATLRVEGTWSGSLSVESSDSEQYTSVPSHISIVANETSVQSRAGGSALSVRLSLDGQLSPGRYTVAVTLSDGLIKQTAYLFVTVEATSSPSA